VNNLEWEEQNASWLDLGKVERHFLWLDSSAHDKILPVLHRLVNKTRKKMWHKLTKKTPRMSTTRRRSLKEPTATYKRANHSLILFTSCAGKTCYKARAYPRLSGILVHTFTSCLQNGRMPLFVHDIRPSYRVEVLHSNVIKKVKVYDWVPTVHMSFSWLSASSRWRPDHGSPHLAPSKLGIGEPRLRTTGERPYPILDEKSCCAINLDSLIARFYHRQNLLDHLVNCIESTWVEAWSKCSYKLVLFNQIQH
jgi:hypothetical protein